jgi:putative transcriptional regulator
MRKIADEIMEGLEEGLALIRGSKVPGVRIHRVDVTDVDPHTIRMKLHLTQAQMAEYLGTSTSGYRKWEQGHRAPGGAARTLLRVMEREPEAVLRALTQ